MTFSLGDDPGGNQIVPTPDLPGTFDPNPGPLGDIPMPDGPTPPGTPQTPAQANPNAFFDTKQFLLWLAALGVLWLFLSFLADSGYEKFAYSLAALVIGGALIFMGPDAIKNAQTLFN